MLAGSLATAALAACGASSNSNNSSGGSATATAAADSSGEIPAETAGPYPGDGSNGPNVLAESGVVRSDITTSFGAASDSGIAVKLNVGV